MTTLGTHNFLWRAECSITEGQVLFGVIFVEPRNITTVSTRSVLSYPVVALTHRAPTFYFCPSKQNIPSLPQNRCVFIKCLRAKHVLSWIDTILSLERQRSPCFYYERRERKVVSDASGPSSPSEPNSRRGSVMQSTEVPDDPKVGRLLVRGDI